jgi:hypothetical protein
VSFSERAPSKQWAALKYRGEPFAEVWFKPEGEPFALTFRIPRESFDLPGLGERLTAENLLKSVGITAEEVESPSDLGSPLTPPQDDPHLTLHISLKPPPSAAAIPESMWQELEARWNNILGLEATVETLRISMESLMAELNGAGTKNLNAEERVHALNADVAVWNKAKARVHHALPKLREFIHRATWAAGTPERKKLEELVKSHVRPRIPFPELDHMADQMESLLKERQVLSAHGVAIHQECKGIVADIQGAMRTLQGNAAANANRKRGQTNARGKFF